MNMKDYFTQFEKAYETLTSVKNTFKELEKLKETQATFKLYQISKLDFLKDLDWNEFLDLLQETDLYGWMLAEKIIKQLFDKDFREEHDIEGVCNTDFWHVADRFFQLMLLAADRTDLSYMGLLYQRYFWLMTDRKQTTAMQKCSLDAINSIPQVVPAYAYAYIAHDNQGQIKLREILDKWKMKLQKTTLGYVPISVEDNPKIKFLEIVNKNTDKIENLFVYSPYCSSPSGLLMVTDEEIMKAGEFKNYMENLPTSAYLELQGELLRGNSSYKSSYQKLVKDVLSLRTKKSSVIEEILTYYLEATNRDIVPIVVDDNITCQMVMLEQYRAFVEGTIYTTDDVNNFKFKGLIDLVFDPEQSLVDFQPVDLEYQGKIRDSVSNPEVHKNILRHIQNNTAFQFK